MLSFGRNNSRDVLTALVQQAAAFRADPLNIELANHCAITAWTLCDWVFKEHGTKLGFNNLNAAQLSIKTQCPNLSLFQDVANASKHRNITHYKPKLKKAIEYDGAFQRDVFDSEAFDVSALVLVREDDSEIWFDDSLEDVLRFWIKYFDENNLE